MAETTILQATRALSSIRNRRAGITRKTVYHRNNGIFNETTPLHDIGGAFDREIDQIDQIFADMQHRLENAKVTF